MAQCAGQDKPDGASPELAAKAWSAEVGGEPDGAIPELAATAWAAEGGGELDEASPELAAKAWSAEVPHSSKRGKVEGPDDDFQNPALLLGSATLSTASRPQLLKPASQYWEQGFPERQPQMSHIMRIILKGKLEIGIKICRILDTFLMCSGMRSNVSLIFLGAILDAAGAIAHNSELNLSHDN